MFYNYSLIGYFALLFVAFVATLNGLIIVKTRCYESPFGNHDMVQGPPALRAGLALIALGIASFVGLVFYLVS